MARDYNGGSPLNLIIDQSITNKDGGRMKKHMSSNNMKYLKSIFNNNLFNIKGYDKSQITSDASIRSLNNNEDNTTTFEDLLNLPSTMKLQMSDFAYLRDIGTFPTNRLMIARRFSHGVVDDLTSITDGSIPLSTLVSHVKEDDDFIKIKYSEEWVEAEHSFESILNSMGNDFTPGDSDNSGKKWGAFMGKFSNIMPMPGMSEGLQYKVMQSLGWTDVDPRLIPYGNPNLIREAKRRKVLERGGGSTLRADITIDFETTYEIKYYPGLDPRLVYLDVIANALSFGTSDSNFQLNGGASKEFNTFLSNVSSGNPKLIKTALLTFIKGFIAAVAGILKDIMDSVEDIYNGLKSSGFSQEGFANLGNHLKSSFEKMGSKIIQTVVNKYKVRIMGVINALTGTPSGHWHITIGNPKKPILSSGDMIASDVSIEMGPVLNFNDMPSHVKIKFTLRNARSLGAQEIFRKLNCGKDRSYKVLSRSFISENFLIEESEYESAKISTITSEPNTTASTKGTTPGQTLTQKYSEVIAATRSSIISTADVLVVNIQETPTMLTIDTSDIISEEHITNIKEVAKKIDPNYTKDLTLKLKVVSSEFNKNFHAPMSIAEKGNITNKANQFTKNIFKK